MNYVWRGARALALALCLLVAPAVYAVFPLAVFPGVVLAFESGTLAASYAAATALIGTLVYWVKFPSATLPGGAVSLRINNNAPKPVPSGWSSPSAATPGADPIPCSPTCMRETEISLTTASGWIGAGLVFGTVSEFVVAAKAHPFVANASIPCTAFTESYSNPTYTVTATGPAGCGGGFPPYSTGAALLCGVGSAWDNALGKCVYSNPSLVPYPPDGHCSIISNGTSFSGDPRDPDCYVGADLKKTGVASPPPVVNTPNVELSTDKKTITVRDPTGAGPGTQVQIQADGSVIVTKLVPLGDGTSTRTRYQIGQQDATAGQGGGGRLQGGVEDRVIGTGFGSGLITPVVQTAGGGTSGDITCPTCALEATQQQVKAAVESIKNDGVKIKEDSASWDAARNDATAKQAAASTALDAHEAKFAAVPGSGLGALGVPGLSDFSAPVAHEQPAVLGLFVPASTCAPLVTSFGSRSITFDFCPAAAVFKSLCEWFLYGLTVLYIYGAFWRRPSGGVS